MQESKGEEAGVLTAIISENGQRALRQTGSWVAAQRHIRMETVDQYVLLERGLLVLQVLPRHLHTGRLAKIVRPARRAKGRWLAP